MWDRYHSTDNKMYEVVEGTVTAKAYAKFIEDVKMPEIDEIFVTETMQTPAGEACGAVFQPQCGILCLPTAPTANRAAGG